MPREVIYIEKGSRIQYCSIAKILVRDENSTKYEHILPNGTIHEQSAPNYNFDMWYWAISDKTLSKIKVEREKLQKELDYLNYLEQICQEK